MSSERLSRQLEVVLGESARHHLSCCAALGTHSASATDPSVLSPSRGERHTCHVKAIVTLYPRDVS